MNDLWGALTSSATASCAATRSITKKGAKIVTLGIARSLSEGQLPGFRRFQDVDLAIAGDGEASLPALIEAVKRLIDDGRKSAFEARGKKLAAAHLAMVEQAKSRRDARLGRKPDHDRAHVRRGLCPDQGRGLVAGRQRHPQRLAAPAVGHQEAPSMERRLRRRRRRLQPAGLARRGARQQEARPLHASRSAATATSCSCPGTLWTAAHHQIPMLYIVHNNRAYHQEYMYLAGHGGAARPRRRQRAISAPRSRTRTSTTPRWRAAWASMAKDRSPIRRTSRRRSSARSPWSRRGEPALIDVVTDPR